MTVEEIKALRLAGQYLTAPASMQTVARGLCGVQAQFLSNALHALRIRCTDSDETANGLLKSWTLRGTMHLFVEEDLPVFFHRDRRRFLRPCDTLAADEKVTAERKRQFAELILSSIDERVSEGESLKAVCRDAGMTDEEGESIFNAWGGLIRALCEEGHLCHCVQEKKAFRRCPTFKPLEAEPAQLAMAERYFAHYGPATIRDAAYFLGATQSQVKHWLDQLPVTPVQCEGRSCFQLGACDAKEIPDCLFLAGFDPLMMGYEKTESFFLPQAYLRGIFNLAGIVMPAVLLHGSVAGKWKKTGKKLTVSLFRSISASEKQQITASAEALWSDLNKIVWEGV